VIVNELAEGGELFFYVKNSGAFSEDFARYIYLRMLNSLKYVHDGGFAHRDIKPDNILLDKDFNIKIADFGFAGPIMGRNNSGGYLFT
jgi:serine/threonine protein kinase